MLQFTLYLYKYGAGFAGGDGEMKKTNGKIDKEITFYIKKLPLVKQVEALDFIKWLWVSKKSPEDHGVRFETFLKKIWNRVEKEPITENEIDKIVEEARSERYAKSSS